MNAQAGSLGPINRTRMKQMDKASLLVAAMAEHCTDRIQNLEPSLDVDLPKPLQPQHLHWMCTRIVKHVEDWPPAKLHRWIGFIQCAMIANRMLSLEEAKTMFDGLKIAYGDSAEDLLDHLDPDSSFEVDIGGEG
jgi:hypothetical protein